MATVILLSCIACSGDPEQRLHTRFLECIGISSTECNIVSWNKQAVGWNDSEVEGIINVPSDEVIAKLLMRSVSTACDNMIVSKPPFLATKETEQNKIHLIQSTSNPGDSIFFVVDGSKVFFVYWKY